MNDTERPRVDDTQLSSALVEQLTSALAPRYRLVSMRPIRNGFRCHLAFSGGRELLVSLCSDGDRVANLGRLGVSYTQGRLSSELCSAIVFDVVERWRPWRDSLGRIAYASSLRRAKDGPRTPLGTLLDAVESDAGAVAGDSGATTDPMNAALSVVFVRALHAGMIGDVDTLQRCEERLVLDPAAPPAAVSALLAAAGRPTAALLHITGDPELVDWRSLQRQLIAGAGKLQGAPCLAGAEPTADLLTRDAGWPGVLAVTGLDHTVDGWLTRAAALEPCAQLADYWRQRVALWRGRPASSADDRSDARSLDAQVVAAGQKVRAGALDDATALLDAIIVAAPDHPEALTWRAEVALVHEDFQAAMNFAHAACLNTNHLPARLIKALATLGLSAAEGEGLPSQVDEGLMGEELSSFLKVPIAKVHQQTLPEWRSGLEAMLARLGGNRSGWGVACHDGALVPIASDQTVRALAGALQHRLAYEPLSLLLQRYDALAERYPHSAQPWTFRGELLLWWGRYDQARACFTRALDINACRWGYVGLGAACLMAGDLDAAQAAFDTLGDLFSPVPRATTPVYLGMLADQLGRPDQAEAHFANATSAVPERIGAWVERGRLALRRGDEALAAECQAAVAERCPALHARLSLDTGLASYFHDALGLLVGNRASRMVTIVTDDVLTLLPAPEPWRTARSVVRQSTLAVGRADNASGWTAAMAVKATARPSLLGRWRPDDALADRFVRHGFVRVRGGVSKTRVARWVASARERGLGPGGCLVRGERRERASHDIASPGVPASGLVVPAERFFGWHALNEDLVRGVSTLIGGLSMSRFCGLPNEVIASPFCDLDASEGGWHVDEPLEAATPEQLQLGLLVLVLLNDVGPGHGTRFAAGSARHIAQALRAGPVDLSEGGELVRHLGSSLPMQTADGEAGDVYLLHPWTVHASGRGRVDAVRLVANPNIMLTAPLIRSTGRPSTPIERHVWAELFGADAPP